MCEVVEVEPTVKVPKRAELVPKLPVVQEVLVVLSAIVISPTPLVTVVALQHLLRFSFWLRLIEVEVGDSCDMRSRHVHRAEGIGVQYLLLGCAVFAVCSVHILDFVTT